MHLFTPAWSGGLSDLIPDHDVAGMNRRAYGRPAVVRYYLGLEYLLPAEEVILAACEPEWVGRDVLDVGFGGGRTTGFLAPRAGRYVGVDYVPGMIEATAGKYPGLDLRVADARDLSDFADASFDFVVFSYNSIDSIGHECRLRAQGEIFRVLRPGGLYMFSSHNLDALGSRLFLPHMLKVKLSWSPLATLKSFGRVAVRIRNYLRNRIPARPGEVHALAPDPGTDFAAPLYYVGAAEARRQLVAAGFEQIMTYDWDGRPADSGVNTTSESLYYLARKPAAS